MAQIMTDVNNFIYELDNKIYVNLTNACTNECEFCIRNQKDDVKGANMWLNEKPTMEKVIAQLEKKASIIANGVTFCGYGEPLLELDLLISVAKYIKQNYPGTRIKINTNGHANAVHKKDILPLLKGYIDEISISLNTHNSTLYNKLCNPKIDDAYNEVIEFAKKSVSNGIKTTFTVVTGYKDFDIDVDACKNIAAQVGADFRERPWIENGY